MKIAIIGPGAMGCLFAAYLSRAGHDVLLCDKRPNRAETLSRTGVTIRQKSGEFHTATRSTANFTDISDRELVMFWVKAYDTMDAVARWGERVSSSAVAVTLQNGLGNLELLREKFGDARVVGGVTAHGATLLEPGIVRHAGTGKTVVGGEAAARVAMLLHEAGIPAEVTPDLEGAIWSKLVVNVAINPLTALLQVRNGELVRSAETKLILRSLAQEAVGVAKKKNVVLLFDDAAEAVEKVCRETAENISSMLQDVFAKKRTEVEWLNGAVVSEGQKIGMSCPLNAAVLSFVRVLESTYTSRVEKV